MPGSLHGPTEGSIVTIPCWDEDYRILNEVPEPQEGTYYLVARPVARYCQEREDLVVAHDMEYEDLDDWGNHTVVVRGLSLWAGSKGV